MLEEISYADISSKEFKEFSRLYNHWTINPWMHWPRRDNLAFHQIFLNQSRAGRVFLFKNEKNLTIGICRIVINNGPYGHIIKIASVGIDPKYQGKGYGKKLLQELEEYIIKEFPTAFLLTLTYEKDNPVAMKGRIYSKAGFKHAADFSDWFRTNDELNSITEHPWYSGEWFSGKLLSDRLPTTGYQTYTDPKQSLQIDVEPKIMGEYTSHLANRNDAQALSELYETSLTELSYIPATERILHIESKISSSRFFIVRSTSGEIVAACEVDERPAGLEQLAIIQNIIITQPEAGTVLFNHLINRYKYSDVRRLEMTLPAGNQHAVRALLDNGFKYTGKQEYGFRGKDGNYYDEYYFEYSMFSLKDAIECCERRKKAEKNLKGTDKKFDLYLPLEFLLTLKKELIKIQTNYPTSFAQERLIFQLVRIICTQDCDTYLERIKMYQGVYEQNQEMFSVNFVKNIYDICMGLLEGIKPIVPLDFFKKSDVNNADTINNNYGLQGIPRIDMN